MTPKFDPRELSYQCAGLPDRAACLAAVAACLGEAIGADVVGWAAVDLAAGTAEIRSDPPAAPDDERRLASVLPDIPTIRHYQHRPDDPDPLRMSDLIAARDWRNHPAYLGFYRPMGLMHHMALSVGPRTPVRGAGWYLIRSGSDFPDAALDLVRSLRPVLTVLDLACPAGPVLDGVREEARRRAGLTERELDVLTLLADGLTARQIATLRRISVRTVGKHLEHVYDKLGYRDRLQAVNEARRLGLLP
ncbi:response regulator transcription factor [Actinomadura rupiterrae]|uniref:response regulator transcription factor n=1 Tax=Actinomadura rupiterrae TaxID=559627 RepID=UPI0020A5784C|nr:LuxR C-terminal-related transcriptional regulator [Actinomadura rupiterrae]MCP2342310.1 DNA-binding CsgD family transcriptional regulator [Actinomadura rupiterrae]